MGVQNQTLLDCKTTLVRTMRLTLRTVLVLSVLLLVITTWAADVEQDQQEQQGLRSDFSGERNVRTKRRYLQKGKGISKPKKGRKREAGSRNKIKKAKNNHKSRKSETKNEGGGSAKRKNKGKNNWKK